MREEQELANIFGHFVCRPTLGEKNKNWLTYLDILFAGLQYERRTRTG